MAPSRIPQDIWQYEEEEVDRRESDRDLVIYKQTCNEIRSLMKDILDLKQKKKTEAEIEEKRVQATLLFVTLKKLNRLEKLKSKKCRDSTNEAKHRVDNFQLQLQNLLYESLHLKKEVDKCVEFKSKDEEIELVPIEEFYANAPAHIAKQELTKQDKHQLMLARLHWELEQRQQLADKCKQAFVEKEKIISEIKIKQEHLDDLSPRLATILQATRPLQNYLDMSFHVKKQENKIARLLPTPLFILHTQANAFLEACDERMSVSIEGDVDEANAVLERRFDRDDDSGESDNEELSTNKRHRRRTTDRMTNSRKKLLQKHPLSVLVSIQCQGNNSLVLRFFYLISLHIVTVECSLNAANLDGDVLNTDSLLTCLFPEDCGDDTPNPTNHFQLEKLGLKEFSAYINELGRPYRWAQLLAGLEFPTQEAKNHTKLNFFEFESQHSISANHIAHTVAAIRKRVDVRLSLQQQVSSLARCSIPISPFGDAFPSKITARLVSWKPITWEEFLTEKDRNKLVEDGLLSENSILFGAQIERASAKLRAQISINPNYPETNPMFHLSVTWKQERNSFDEALRVMEREVNVFCMKNIELDAINFLLTSQIQHLLMCFDVYLETNTATNIAFEGPVEFPKEKIFLRSHSGRDRSKPYKFVAKCGFFTQR